MATTCGQFARVSAVLLLLAVGSRFFVASAVAGERLSRGGPYEGGQYEFDVPANWNGGLVLYAHGFRGGQHSPLASHLAARGYALAGSSYREGGYHVDWFVDDMRALLALFTREVRRPRWAIIHGQSMGGHVAILSLELHPELYQGALIECGVIDGVGVADYYVAARAAAEYLSGVNLFDAPDYRTLVHRVYQRWLPLMGMPGAYTERGRRFDSVLKYLIGGDLPLRQQGLADYYLRNLIVDLTDSQELFRAASTVSVRYRVDPGLGVREDDLNAGVRRIVPPRGARSRRVNPAFAELTGRIGVPVLAIHETGDGNAPWSLQQSYRRRTLAAGTAHLLVQRAVRWPGHCAFDGEIRDQAFDDLVAWIERGVKPDGDDVLAADVAALGLRWTPRLHPEDPARGQR